MSDELATFESIRPEAERISGAKCGQVWMKCMAELIAQRALKPKPSRTLNPFAPGMSRDEKSALMTRRHYAEKNQ